MILIFFLLFLLATAFVPINHIGKESNYAKILIVKFERQTFFIQIFFINVHNIKNLNSNKHQLVFTLRPKGHR